MPKKDPPNCMILDSWAFEKKIVADEPFVKALRIYETCVLVNNNLWKILVASLELPTAFDKRFEVTWVTCFIFWF